MYTETTVPAYYAANGDGPSCSVFDLGNQSAPEVKLLAIYGGSAVAIGIAIVSIVGVADAAVATYPRQLQKSLCGNGCNPQEEGNLVYIRCEIIQNDHKARSYPYMFDINEDLRLLLLNLHPSGFYVW